MIRPMPSKHTSKGGGSSAVGMVTSGLGQEPIPGHSPLELIY